MSARQFSSLAALPLLLAAAACATAKPAPQSAVPPEDPRVGELQKQVETLKNKLDGMEFKLSTLHDKIDATRTSVETLDKTRDPQDKAAEIHPSVVDGALAATGQLPSDVKKPTSDPEQGFVTDQAVQSYRKAMVLFEAGRHSEAILGFTQFLDQHADHPWAGSAQYHVGLGYLAQKECKLAIQEFTRVLTSYDRSPHVPDALFELSRCEDELKQKKQAAEHRQLLLSLYPNSPAARRQRNSVPVPVEPVRQPETALPATAPAPQGNPSS